MPVSEPLTGREEILHLLVQGNANKQIARSLHIADETVKTHSKKIYGKLSVQSRAQAILTTMRLSLVSFEASFTKGTHFLPSRMPGVLERKEKR